MLSALGMYMIALPHFIGQDLISSPVPITNKSTSGEATTEADLCTVDRMPSCQDGMGVKDYGSLVVIFMGEQEGRSTVQYKFIYSTDYTIGIFLVGIGISFFYSFGIPYVDDNSGKGDSPFYLSVVTTARSIGPTLGYILGGALLSVNVDLTSAPEDIDQDDPRWIGAWWLGFIIVGTLVFVLSPLLTLFPERLPAKDNTDAKLAQKEKGENPSTVKEWLEELKLVSFRLLTNKIWMLNLVSTKLLIV